MKGIYGVHSFNTNTYLFTNKRQIKEKHQFIAKRVFSLTRFKFLKIGQR